MITAIEAQEISKIKQLTEEEVETGIKMMAQNGSRAWARTGSVSAELEEQLKIAGFTVYSRAGSNSDTVHITW